MTEGRPLVRKTALATGATLLGYVATIVQQLVYARALGVGSDVDALAAALAWSLAITGFVGTTFASAVVPAYLRLRAAGDAGAGDLFRSTNTVALLIGLALSAGSFAFAPAVAPVLLPGASGATLATLSDLLRLTAPMQLLWIAVITGTALANAQGRYVAAAAITILPSLAVLVSILAYPSVTGAGMGYVLGYAIELAVLLIMLRESWHSDLLPERPAAVGPLVRPILFIGFALLLINGSGVAIRAIASLGGPGDLAVFDYASRLSLAAEAILSTSALAVVFTVWSEDSSRERHRLPLARTLAVAAALSSVAAAAVAALAPIVVGLLFQGGRFGAADTARVSLVLALLAPGMAGRIVHMMALRALLAWHGTWSMAVVGVTALAGVIGGGLLGQAIAGLGGAALGYSCAWICVAVVTAVAAISVSRGHGPSRLGDNHDPR